MTKKCAYQEQDCNDECMAYQVYKRENGTPYVHCNRMNTDISDALNDIGGGIEKLSNCIYDGFDLIAEALGYTD